MPHGFFGRRGGVSAGIYSSLNAGPGSKDDPAAIAENRRRIAAAFGRDPQALIGVHQVHSPTAVIVDAPWAGVRPEADALATRTPGLVLSILTADCAPVLLADREAGVIGAAHAGWKGAHGGVLEAAVAAMVSLGAAPERIIAAIGPCIHQASYEVGPEFAARFAEWERHQFFQPGQGDRLMFDLPSFCVSRLQRSGVKSIETLAHDTYAGPATLFSHRRSVHEKLGDYGRNCAAITLSQN
jgi:YfiH family protein